MTRSITLEEIARMTGGVVKGDPLKKVSSVLPPEKAGEESIAPLWEKKFLPFVKDGSALFTKKGWIGEGNCGVEADEPRAALVKLLAFFDETEERAAGVSKRAAVSAAAEIGSGVFIAEGAIVSDGVKIGDGSVIMENVFIARDCAIGSDCVIEPGAVIYRRTVIGNNCVIHANAVIGCEGFGFIPDPKRGMIKIPQIGITRIADGVEIGACASVDRATFGETYIGEHTKIDSHVKIGHNCEIGAYSIIVAQSGVAGSTKIGKGVIMAAQSGVANHATVGDGCTIGGRSGVFFDLPAGSVVSGFPAQEHKKELRQQALIKHLPDMARRVKELEARLALLEKKNEDASR